MTLEDENIAAQTRAQRAKESSGGAHQSIGGEDNDFSKFKNWTWAFFGLAFMSMQLWLVSSVADIKASLPRLSDKDMQIDAHQASTDRRVDKLEDRMDYVRSKLDQYEGKTLRGPAEPARGD